MASHDDAVSAEPCDAFEITVNSFDGCALATSGNAATTAEKCVSNIRRRRWNRSDCIDNLSGDCCAQEVLACCSMDETLLPARNDVPCCSSASTSLASTTSEKVARSKQLPLNSNAAAMEAEGSGGMMSINPIFNLDVAVGLVLRAKSVCYQRNAKRWHQRRRRSQLQETEWEKFNDILAEHQIIMSLMAGTLGHGQLCRKCFEPVHGIVCFQLAGEPLHWLCAGCPLSAEAKPPVRQVLSESENFAQQLHGALVAERCRQARHRSPMNSRIDSKPSKLDTLSFDIRQHHNCKSSAMPPKRMFSRFAMKSHNPLHTFEEMRLAGVFDSLPSMTFQETLARTEKLVRLQAKTIEKVQKINDEAGLKNEEFFRNEAVPAKQKRSHEVGKVCLCFLFVLFMLRLFVLFKLERIGETCISRFFAPVCGMTKEITALQSPFNFSTQRLPSAAGENKEAYSRSLLLAPEIDKNIQRLSSATGETESLGYSTGMVFATGFLFLIQIFVVSWNILVRSREQNLLIQCLDNKTYHIKFNSYTRVSDVMSRLESLLGTPCDQQRLVWQGSLLQESDVLVQHRVVNNSILHFVPRSMGGGGSCQLLDEDVLMCLSWSRPLELQAPTIVNEDNFESVHDNFAFVPEMVLALLVSMGTSSQMVRRLMQQDWVSTWNGWVHFSSILDNSYDDGEVQSTALECIQSFARISLQNQEVRGKSDTTRKAEIEAQRKHIGLGQVYDRNQCCADSLLQLLARRGFVVASFWDNTFSRRRACEACRQHLIHHSDPSLHPKERTSTGAVANVSDMDHDRAFLQHDVQGPEIIKFFVQTYPGARSLPAEGVIIRVYTRWDSPALPAESNSVIACRSAALAGNENPAPTVLFEMYNSTGNGFTGYHYDPVFDLSLPAPIIARDASSSANPSQPSSKPISLTTPTGPAAASATELRKSGSGSKPTVANDNVCKRPAKVDATSDQIPLRRRLRQKTSSLNYLASEETARRIPLKGIDVGEAGVSEAIDFFEITCLSRDISPDVRVKMEAAVEKLAEQLRLEPTLPADSSDTCMPCAAALLEDCAIQLPAKHCAFRGCDWHGDSNSMLIGHLLENHRSELQACTDLYPSSTSLHNRLLSAYSAAI